MSWNAFSSRVRAVLLMLVAMLRSSLMLLRSWSLRKIVTTGESLGEMSASVSWYVLLSSPLMLCNVNSSTWKLFTLIVSEKVRVSSPASTSRSNETSLGLVVSST